MEFSNSRVSARLFSSLEITTMPSMRAHFCVFLLACSFPVCAQNFKSAKIISPNELPAGISFLASGDLNGDGIADLVYSVPPPAGTSGHFSIGIALGSRSGFTLASTYQIALGNVVLADLNGDGKPDIIGSTTTGATAELVTMLNNGDGTFASPVVTQVVTNNGTWPLLCSPAVGDFDGDGNADVIVSDQNGHFYFFHGNGDGKLSAGSGFQSNIFGGYQLTAADFNKDGKLDLLLACPMCASVSVALGNGDGTFKAPVVLKGQYNYTPFVGDFNGDGVLDIATLGVVADQGGDYGYSTANIFIGNGDGTFQLANSYTYPGLAEELLGVTDLNGDGNLDLIVQDANGFSVAFGQGKANFGAFTTYSAPTWGTSAVLGDFDGDGFADIIGQVQSQAYKLKGLPGGKFDAAGALVASNQMNSINPLNGIATADLNGDGRPDLVALTTIGLANVTFVFLSNGDGTFTATSDTISPPSLSLPTNQLFLADFDGDHIPDALYVPGGAYANVLFRHGNGDGTFGAPVMGPYVYHGAPGASVGDLTGNGILDLVGEQDAPVSVWLGNGNGGFGSGTAYYSSVAYGNAFNSKTVIADINNDGVKDVLATADSGIVVFLGTGDGAGTLSATSVAYPGGEFTVADVNADGKLDLIALPTSGTGFNVYLGDGTGNFGSPTTIATSLAYSHITTADLNLDGIPDVILSGTVVAVMYGDGKGGFGPEQIFLAGTVPQTALVGDWNMDGAPDIAVANTTGASPSSNSITLFLNCAGDATSLAASLNPAQYGQPVTLSATVSPTVVCAMTPAGTVTLLVDGVQTFQGALTNGSYSTPLGAVAAGSHSIIGAYAGDGNFLPGKFAPLSLKVIQAQTTTAIAASANPATFGSSLQLSVSVQPAFSGTPSGSVSVFDGSQTIATQSLDGDGKAQIPLAALSQGTHALSVRYAGDTNFRGSSSAALTESVLYPVTVSLSSSAPSALVGTAVTFTANISSSYGEPSGTVSFLDGNQSLGVATLSGSSATLHVPALTEGVHNVKVSYPGGGAFISGSGALSQAITDFTIAAPVSSLSLAPGESSPLTVNIAPMSGFTGAVALSCTGAPALATCIVSPFTLQVKGASSALITVTTTGPNAAPHQAAARSMQTNFLFSLMSVFGLVITIRSPRRSWMLCLVVAAAVLALSACGGTKPATPPGTTPLTVTASTTSGTVTVVHSLTLTLNVQ